MLQVVKKWRTAVFAVAALILCAMPSAAAAAAGSQSQTEQQAFAKAAQEFGVPENLLLAVSYNESRWEMNTGASIDGGYGVMDLRTYAGATTSGRDGSIVTPPKQADSVYTLDQAAALLHESAGTLKTDMVQNIRGGAAVLAADAKQLNNGQLPGNINDWYAAAAQFSGSTDAQASASFADDVYATVKAGATLTTAAGQQLSLAATATVAPSKTALPMSLAQPERTNLPGQQVECPSTLNCRFISAAYAQNDPNDPTNYGNFDYAHRPSDMQIKYIYIHDTEGSYDSAISHFQDPTAFVSANYVIRSSDGAITQMVPNADVAWGVGNWYQNMHGINIEHEGFAAQGATWYTEAMYQSSATLVRWLANKYHIPLDRQHILGHEDVSRFPAPNQATQHWDPGPYWDWNHYMALIHGQSDQAEMGTNVTSALTQGLHVGQVVTISPNFATNQPPIQDCGNTGTGPCTPEPAQGANFVYLHTQPGDSAPLVSDPYMHKDGAPGTTVISDWSAKASTGFQYVVAGVQGDWTGIWFANQIGWFYNPHGTNQTAHHSYSPTVTPRTGVSSIPVYAAAFPELSAYPSDVPPESLTPSYSISAGQTYTTTAQNLPTDYFYDATINYSKPDDHIIVHGNQKYYQIAFNHHTAFVNVNDVTLKY
jgi:N-acetyl-anhydromuramyl-L-alanine amidase AmpD